MSEILRLEGLTKSYGPHAVLRGIDLSVQAGETICVIGASGSGKSTLLRCINFLELPSGGRVVIEGKAIGRATRSRAGGERIVYSERELTPLRSRVGMVFQQFNLFPHLTAEQNVMLAPVRIRGLPAAEARRIAIEQLDRVGLGDRRDAYPARLSGGQQQRVAIARALAMEPKIMLFDEATSALDPELVGEVLQTMRRLAQDGMTMLVVTHELGFAYNVASRVLFLHEGVVHEEGPAQQLMRRPARERTRAFIQAVTSFQLPGEAG